MSLQYFITILFINFFGYTPNTLLLNSLESSVNSEIVVKSLVSDDYKEIRIEITLPDSGQVGFELQNKENHILHQWNDQIIERGVHRLSLPLPTLETGKYLLLIKVGENHYKHFVIIQ